MSDKNSGIPATSTTSDVVLETRNVTKRFPGVLANDDVSIKLHRGEILALLGENGAGKSTLMNIIYGLYHQDEGQVLLRGQEVRFSSPREAIHSGIGMVHQHFQLIPVMTVAENVVLGEEKESPTWRSVFTILFTSLMILASFWLAVRYNAPLVYNTFTFALVAVLLPIIALSVVMQVGQFIRDRKLTFVTLTAALSLAFSLIFAVTISLTTLVIVLAAALISFGIMWISRQLIEMLHPTRRQVQVVLGSLFLGVGIISMMALAFDADLNAREIFISLVGMMLIIALGFLLPLSVLRNPFGNRLRAFLPSSLPAVAHEVGTIFLSLLTIGAAGLGIVAIAWLLFQTILEDSVEIKEALEFLAVLHAAVMGIAILSFGLGWILSRLFKNWETISAGWRLVWGVAWRIGLIGAAIWIGGLTEEVSRMAIITGMLQSDVPFVIQEENAGAKGKFDFAVGWRNIERVNGFDAQVGELLNLIDETFYREETFETSAAGYTGAVGVQGYQSINTAWRDAVDDVPVKIRDIVIGLLLIVFAALALSGWRGHRALPGALSYDLYILGAIGLIFLAAIWITSKELNTALRLGLMVLGIGIIGLVLWRTVNERRAHPERIRPISPFDNAVDALTDLLYTLFSLHSHHQAANQVRTLSQQYGLEVDPDVVVEKLPVGLQQRVEIIKALYRRAGILILDEPTAVLTPQEGKELFKIMRELAAQGVSIIFITHKLKEVFEVATNIVVMRGGAVVGTTTPAEATEGSLAAMMVGREVLLRVEKSEAQPVGTVLHVEHLKAYDDRGALALDGVSFEVKAGEVLGIAGVQGNGQSELVEVLTGLRSMSEGGVELLGQALKPERHPDSEPWRRVLAFLIDTFVIAVVAIIVSYFWNYFENNADNFVFVSSRSVLLFIAFDAIYTLGSWQLWGATLGKILLNLQIVNAQHDNKPEFTRFLTRYVGARLTLIVLLIPLAVVFGAISALTSESRSTQVLYTAGVVAVLGLIATLYWHRIVGLKNRLSERMGRRLDVFWYDRLPQVNCRVVHRISITPRAIKDLQSSHVPEDRHRFGMVKPFSITENLILNDYYQAPHAQQPTRLQLPLLSIAYTLIFGAVFAAIGYLWLYFWNETLWHDLLDTYGTPNSGKIRSIPITRGMSALQRNYVDDPLIVSLLILLAMLLLVSVLSYFATGAILRFLTRPYSFIPPLALFAGSFVVFWAGSGLLDAISSKAHDALLLASLAVINPILGIISLDFNNELNRVAFALLGLACLIVTGNWYTWWAAASEHDADFLELKRRFGNTRLGQFIEMENKHGLILNLQDSVEYSNQLIKEYDIRTPSALNTAGSLSGGNQQKMVVAREFSRKPRLLIASQPTRGIDVGSIEFIHKRIVAQRDQGAAVLLVSAELDEIMSLSDRIAVMYKGQIIQTVQAKGASREELGLLMAGIVKS